jgi:nucleoside-diphosphate-sugar epimerase
VGLGQQVIATSRSANPDFDQAGTDHLRLEVLDLEASPISAGGRVAIICPWVPLVGSAPPPDWVSPLLERLAHTGTTTVVYFSTIWVYGDQLAGRLTEESPTGSTNPYASAHLDNESRLTRIADRHGLDITLLRMSNLIGADPFFRWRSKIAFAHELTAMAVNDRQIVLRSPPDTRRNLLPRSLLHHYLTAILNRPLEPGRVSTFNVGGPDTTTMLELAKLIATVVEQHDGQPVRIEHLAASGGPQTFHLDTDRIHSLAGAGPDDLTRELSMILADLTHGRCQTVSPS